MSTGGLLPKVCLSVQNNNAVNNHLGCSLLISILNSNVMKISSLFYLVILFGFISCTTSQVTVPNGQYESFDIGDYKSFSFLDIETEKTDNPNFHHSVTLLQEEITSQFSEIDIPEGDANPSLGVNIGITVEDKVQTRETSLATDPFTYTGQRNYTWKSEEIVVNTYKQGTLTIHLIDLASNEAVWVGIVSKVIPNKEEKRETAIKDAVEAIFNKIKE